MERNTWRIALVASAIAGAVAFQGGTLTRRGFPRLDASSFCSAPLLRAETRPASSAAALLCKAGSPEEGLKKPPTRVAPAAATPAAAAAASKPSKWKVHKSGGLQGSTGGRWQGSTGGRQGSTGGKGPTVSEFNNEISQLGKAGKWQEALKTLETMQEKGFKPTQVSYNAAISALTKNGQWQQAIDMFDIVFRGTSMRSPRTHAPTIQAGG